MREKVNSKQEPFVPSKNGSIQLIELPHRHGSARAIAAAFNILSISTPYVMIGQHDNFFVRDVSYLRQLLLYMEKPDTNSWLQCVHFPSTATLNYVQKVKRRYDLDISRLCVDCDDDGVTVEDGDCDDFNPRRSPLLQDRCDGIDNDCSGEDTPVEEDSGIADEAQEEETKRN